MDSRLIINIIDNLNSTSNTEALSANMGRVLNETKLGIIEYTHSDRTMVLHLSNGLLIQTGNTLITPESANARTYKEITFTKSYTQHPVIIPSVATAYPSVVKASCSSTTLTGATFVLDRDTVSETAIRWIAIGYRNPEL